MRSSRRQFMYLATVAAALPGVSRIAGALTYPSRPVRIIVGAPAGSAPDILARLIGQWLSERLGQPFVIEARLGAGSNIAAEAVVNAAPDGHTLLLASPAAAINATLYKKLNYNFIRDIAPVAGISREPQVMLVNPTVPARTIPEFIAHAKANPGKLSMASPGHGTAPHMAGELFKMMTGIDMVHVPYHGSAPALTDLLGGQVQVMFVPLTASIEHVRSGKLRALAVTTQARSEALPQVPTVGDFVKGYEVSSWFGVGAPKGVPVETIEILNREINLALVDPRIAARLSDLGSTVLRGSPAEFGALIARETEKWSKVIRSANLGPAEADNNSPNPGPK
jgi:tripartite-type tricarboxylate transporter receptor subunit TctC